MRKNLHGNPKQAQPIFYNLSLKSKNTEKANKLILSTFLMLTLLLLASIKSNAQVVINEILPGGTVELKNIGNTTIDVSGYWLCDFPAYQEIGNSNIQCGNTSMAPGEILTVDDFNTIDANDGEMGLYTTNSFGSSSAIVDYVEWGSSGHQRATVAEAAGIWTTGTCVPAFGSGESLSYTGSGDGVDSWVADSNPDICEENSVGCTAEGGTLEGGPYEFCVGDGIADNVSGITLMGNSGANSQWVVTDDQGTILGLPPSPEVVDFDGAGDGICLVWHLSYEDGLTGLEVNMNTADLEGCFDLSNAVTVDRNQPEGGTLEGGPYEFCVGDGIADNVSGITLMGNSGANSQWVVTDDQGTILGLPPSPEVVDFDGAGDGICLVWHLSYEDGLTGLEVNMNTADLEGCFDLSNAVTVIRNQPEGGTLEGGPYEFCVGDGIADNVSGITLMGNSGANSQWVVTDDQGTILGLPPSPEVVNFDGAGYGICLIWHLSYEDGLTGLAVNMNTADLEGCFDLSNAVTVIRNQPEGGELSTADGMTELAICAGDGNSDAFDVSLSGTLGANSAWIITDDQGNILALPMAPPFDLEGAGDGVCQVWHISYEDGLLGLEVGMNTSGLAGCFGLSNPIIVDRITTDGLEGGTLEGETYEFCVGDGIADNVSGITLSGNSGANSQWVITDDQGLILGLPPTPEAVDFDGAGDGICLIWHISYEDGLVGLEQGMNTSGLQGCYSLSNAIEVIRNQPEGGTLEGETYEFCVGDGIADNVSGITLTGNSGANSQWVITDDQGLILGLPPTPEAVDFDGAGDGICLIWHLSYEDGLTGLEVNMNTSDLEGCYSLSNAIEVIRNQPEGGTLEGETYEFCVGDGIADNVSGITLSGNSGANSQWVVTDDQGLILGLPPTPEAVDFDGAGDGICLIWHLSYEDGLTGLEVNMNTSGLEGCYSLSNAIEVIRNQPEAGTLEGGPYEFCVGDGEADNVSDITLTGNSGANSQWIVTDEQGLILGLPPMPEAVDFDGAGVGICLIWHLSYEDGLIGLEEGLNANDLEGCFSLSNAITVDRVDSGDLCVTSTNDFGSVSSLEIFPNPASNMVQITYQGLETDEGNLQLIDITGRVLDQMVLNQVNDNVKMNVAEYTAGYYMIRISDGKRTTSQKLIITK